MLVNNFFSFEQLGPENNEVLKGDWIPVCDFLFVIFGRKFFPFREVPFSEGGRGAVLLGNFFPLRVEPFSEGGKQF